MKILSLTNNSFGQVIAEVLNCGKTIKVFADSKDGLVKAISKACYFTTPDDVRMDLKLNFP